MTRFKDLTIRMSNRGFSLIEVTIAMALMGAGALIMSRMTQNQLKSTKTVETRFEYAAILSEIRNTLSQNASCMATIGPSRNVDSNVPAGSIDRIRQVTPVGDVIEKFIGNHTDPMLAPAYGNGGVRIISYEIFNSDPGDPSIVREAPPAGTHGFVNFVVTFSFGVDKTFSTNKLVRKMKMEVVFDPTTRIITDCAASGGGGSGADKWVDETGDTMTGNLVMEDGAEIEFLSDRRLKKDIRSLKGTLSKIDRLKPVSYRWKKNDDFVYGLIAQDLQKVFPDLVQKSPKLDYLSVDYIQLTPILIKSIQELNQENKELKENQKIMQKQLEALKEDLCHRDPGASVCK